jgi:3-oxoacyl-[acyl-carrier-protein] synthase III
MKNNSNSLDVSIILAGIGVYVPEKIVTNDDLSAQLDTNDEWIRSRTGISERRIAAMDEATSDMGAKAAQEALRNANVSLDEIDLLIVATFSSDYICPSLACVIHQKLGIRSGIPAFDLSAACSGFVYAMEVARSMMLSGSYRNVLVVGAEKLSGLVDWQDRSVCVLFGDGAGAMVLSKIEESGLSEITRGLYPALLGADGSAVPLFYIPAGGSALPASAQTISDRAHFIKMNGKEVFKLAVRKTEEAVRQAVEKAGLKMSDIKLIVPHQANSRILDAMARELKIPLEKIFENVKNYGNTSAASIPIALAEAMSSGRCGPGDIVLLVGFGAGFTWASMLIKL